MASCLEAVFQWSPWGETEHFSPHGSFNPMIGSLMRLLMNEYNCNVVFSYVIPLQYVWYAGHHWTLVMRQWLPVGYCTTKCKILSLKISTVKSSRTELISLFADQHRNLVVTHYPRTLAFCSPFWLPLNKFLPTRPSACLTHIMHRQRLVSVLS